MNALKTQYSRTKLTSRALIKKTALLSLLFFLSSCVDHGAVKVNIDPKSTFQTIDGFGGFGAQKVWWGKAPFYSDEFINILLNDLGITILRDEIPLGFEAINDNEEANIFNSSTNSLDLEPPEAHTSALEHVNYLKAMKEHGLDKLILSVWSPPLWMKHNQHLGNGLTRGQNSAPPYVDSPTDSKPNQLKKEYYEEFAEYCIAYIKLLKEKADIDVYALSLQNEPRFSQWYVSTVYSPDALAELIAVVGKRFDQEDIQTKIFGPEDVASFSAISAYLEAIYKHESAAEHLDIVAIHGYKNDGVSASDSGPKYWRKTKALAEKQNKPLWLTETSGPKGNDYSDAFNYASSIYNGLYYGQVNAWVFWQMSGSKNKTLITNGELNWLYYVSKHFYKHIRPGAVRIYSNSTNKELLTLSFLSANNTYITTILINNSDGEMKPDVDLEGIKSACWQTTSQAPYSKLTCGKHDAPIRLPAKSITTWVTYL